MIEAPLNRRIDVAQTITTRLDHGEPLSGILPVVKTLAGLNDDDEMKAIAELLTYGVHHVQLSGDEDVQERALAGIMPLLEARDISGMRVDSLLRSPKTVESSEYDHMISLSVHDMERIQPPPPDFRATTRREGDLLLQTSAYHSEVQSSLSRVRAFVYDYASRTWQHGVRERDRIELLGPDYRTVLDAMGAFGTPVGNELSAALDRLRSPNPASWKLSALGARNVLLKLAGHLWNLQIDEYESSLLGETLTLKGEREKNKLSAYIDVHWKKASEPEKSLLEEAHDLVSRVYDSGSKGKSQVRHSEAQQLVVDAFRLVDLLVRATGLVPLTCL